MINKSILKCYLKKRSAPLILSMVLISLEVVVGSLQPRLIALIIDNGIQSQDLSYILHIGSIMLGLCLAGYLFGVSATVIAGRVSAQMGHDLRRDLFAKTLDAPLRQSGDIKKESLFNRISGDCSAVVEFVAEFHHIFVKPLVLFLSGMVMLTLLNPVHALVLLGAVAVQLFVVLVLYKKTVTVYGKIQKMIDGLVKVLRQNIIGARTVKVFSRQTKEQQRFNEQNTAVTRQSFRIMRFSSKMNVLIMLVMNLVILLILWISGLQAQTQRFQIGEILAAITYSQQILMALMSFGLFFNSLAGMRVAADRLKEVLALESEQQTAQLVLDEPIEEIIFENVSFCYKDTYYLQDISFTLRKGETLGVLGGTASGKSLLINLLTGLYRVTGGDIFINGKPIACYTAQSLRQRIAVAVQEESIFSESVEENILWGRCGNLAKTAEDAQAREFIEKMRQGYRTGIYDKGRNLSGGQRQRLQLARAFCAPGDVLVVDDAISQTDFLTRKKLLEKILDTENRSMVILTSQRPNMLKGCSKIAVMEHGRIVDLGTPEELASRCGLYQSFCDMQKGVSL